MPGRQAVLWRDQRCQLRPHGADLPGQSIAHGVIHHQKGGLFIALSDKAEQSFGLFQQNRLPLRIKRCLGKGISARQLPRFSYSSHVMYET